MPFRTRGEYLLSLVPPPNADTDLDDDDDLSSDGILDAADAFLDTLDIGEELDTEEENLQVEESQLPVPGPSNLPLKPTKITFQEHKASLRRRPQANKKGKQRKRKTVKASRLKFKWKKEPFSKQVTIPTETSRTANHQTHDLSPYAYFCQFYCKETMDLIVEETNRYHFQMTGKAVSLVTINDIRDFLAIQIYFGVISFPSYKDAWSHELRFPLIADVMPLKKYEKIRRYIHFADSRLVDSTDPFFKIRPLLDKLRENCLKLENEQHQSIDEMMVPYKGSFAGSKKQYMKAKPHKWGYKFFVRSGVSGIVYDFFPYAGSHTFTDEMFTPEENQRFGFTSKVVLRLCQTIPKDPVEPKLYFIYFDNWFTSLDLLSYLRNEYGFLTLGTVRQDRLAGATLKSDKELKKEGRGSFDERVDNRRSVCIVKWYDNKPVHVASSFVGGSPIGQIQRWSRELKRKVDVPCPSIIKQYNHHMGGVDLTDMAIALYRTEMKSKRWYSNIFVHTVDMACCNGWFLRRQETKNDTSVTQYRLKLFKLEVAEALLTHGRIRHLERRQSSPDRRVPHKSTKTTEKKKKRKTPTKTVKTPSSKVSGDLFGHMPVFSSRGKCRHCKDNQTTVMCEKCSVRLCWLPSRNCYRSFHYGLAPPQRKKTDKNRGKIQMEIEQRDDDVMAVAL